MQTDELVEKAVKSAMLSVIKEYPMGHWRDDQVKEVARRAIVEAALSAAEPVASIVPEHCSGSAFVFEGGCLHVRKDGSGHIVVDEADFTLEDDRREGEHGPEGSVHWIARFPAGEMTALRDFLNGEGSSADILNLGEYQNGHSPDEKDIHPDDIAVDRFAAAMKAKLARKRAAGRGGWEDKDDCSQLFLTRLLREHVEKGDPVDVGNLAMMLHQRSESILSLPITLQGE